MARRPATAKPTATKPRTRAASKNRTANSNPSLRPLPVLPDDVLRRLQVAADHDATMPAALLGNLLDRHRVTVRATRDLYGVRDELAVLAGWSLGELRELVGLVTVLALDVPAFAQATLTAFGPDGRVLAAVTTDGQPTTYGDEWDEPPAATDGSR